MYRQIATRIVEKTVRLPRICLSRAPLSSESGKYLVSQQKYSWLQDLGLNEENQGVFKGKWDASGDVSQSLLKHLLHHK